MPRNVRNFWIDASIDGRNSDLSGGPVSKEGGFELVISQRDAGSVTTALEIFGRAFPDGRIILRVRDAAGNDLARIETER